MAHPETTTVTLDQYALVLCATGDGAPLEVALEAAEVPPRDWPAAEAQIAAWLANARSDPGLLPAFDEAMRKAREALSRPVKPIDEDVALWGRWLRGWSTSQDPTGLLERSGMAMSDVVRLSSSWGERMQADRALAERFAEEMAGNAPAPEVRVGESPRLVAAKAALAARRKDVQPADSASRPSLFGALPGEAAAPRVSSGATLAMPAMAPAASEPLPFDPNARPVEMPSQGRQIQSGLTNEVDLSAVVRRVLAFQSPGGVSPISGVPIAPPAAAPNVPVAPPANVPVAPPPNVPVAPPANVPVAPPVGKVSPLAGTAIATPPERPALPFAADGAPGDAADRAKQAATQQDRPSLAAVTPVGATASVNIAALARQVLAFNATKKPDSPPAAAPLVPTLTMEQYASLCVDIEMAPAQAPEILRRYGANEPGKRVLDEGWSRIFAEQPARRTAFESAKVAYRTWLSQGGRR